MRGLWWLATVICCLAGASWAQDTGWIVTTDYSSFGRLRSVGLAEPWPVSADLATVPGDAVAREHEGLIYVVGRGGANLLQVYDPAAGMALVREFSLGNGLNPQDIAFDRSGEAYVSCYDQAVLLRVDVAGEQILDTFSTAAYADADGLPETGWMLARGDRLYLTSQRLDRNNWYAPTGPGQILVFDTVAETFEAPIDLQGADPYTRLELLANGDLRVGCAGTFGVADGGIERVDPAAGLSLGYDVTEAELGGDVLSFAGADGGLICVLVSNAAFVTSVRRYDPAADQLTVLATGTGYVHADLAVVGGFLLLVADRTPAAAGLRVYDMQSGAELTTGVVPTGLPPFMIVVPEAVALSPVTPDAVRPGLSLAAPFPNPSNPQAVVRLSGKPNALVRVSVFDLRGRRLSSGPLQLDASGAADWTFVGRDDRGRQLPSGVYRVVAQSRTGFAARSLTLVR